MDSDKPYKLFLRIYSPKIVLFFLSVFIYFFLFIFFVKWPN